MGYPTHNPHARESDSSCVGQHIMGDHVRREEGVGVLTSTID